MDLNIRIRPALPDDLAQVAALEAVCFPAAEAASLQSFAQRLPAFCKTRSFFVAEQDGRIIGMINGAITDSRTITDAMYDEISLHSAAGAYQSVFGLDTHPAFQRCGVAAALMAQLIAQARADARKGLILTCKQRLIPYYEKFGYQCLGISDSVHGGAVWYDMILEF
ncbi:MAG: GNAT family N-acetyltransferase [Oscillospiraceae bacterium]|nr:GNAT family N-acetyltransferase [Oscillospiraceae bacterium]